MTARTVPTGLRWFASASAFIVAIGATVIGGSLGFSFLHWEVPSLLVVGAILAGSAPGAGRLFMRLGAAILTLWIVPMAGEELFNLHRSASLYGYRSYSRYELQDVAASITVIVLVTAIDIALFLDALRIRKFANS